MNFVFFYQDEMRAESVSCYGHPLVKMPHYDRMAQEGVRFDQCVAQHPVCSPSRCSLMTGWYPHVSGHRTLWHLLRSHEPSLFRYLKEAGYHIQWYGKNDLYAPDYFPGTVDVFEHRGGQPIGKNPYSMSEPAYYSFLHEPLGCSPEQTSDMRNVQAGIDFLRSRSRSDAPFVLYLPLVLPHPPYVAPQGFHDLYAPQDLPPLRPPDVPGKPDFHTLIRTYRGLDKAPDGLMERIQAAYLGMNSYVDWMLGQLLNALDETGLADDTAVFVFADHGDWAGDYGLVEKWPSALDDTIIRVPLLVRMPGNEAGHVAQEPVELFDIMATVLELAGVTARHTHFARSLVPQLHGHPGDPDRPAFAEGGYDAHEPACFEGRWTKFDIPRDPAQVYYPKALQQQEHRESVSRATMIRTRQHKLIRRPSGTGELYDLERDPRELCNCYEDPKHAAVRAALESRLLDWYMHTSDVVPHEDGPRGLP